MPKQVLQLCHGYEAPFLDVARQYSALFHGSEYQVTTVFLIGKENQQVRECLSHDQVIFMDYRSKDLRGLKLKQIRRVKQLAAENRFERIIAHRYKSIYIALQIKNLPVIAVHHAFGAYKRFSRRAFISFYKKRLTLLGVSDAIRDDIRRALPHFPSQQIQTFYNRINFEQLKQKQHPRKAAREQLGLDPQKFYFINIGRLHPDKDQKTLIAGFAEFLSQNPQNAEHVVLYIYGKGRLESELQEQIDALKLQQQVVLKGHYPDLAYWLAAFDAFVLSSDHEPFGMVLLEAMCAGLPVVSTAQGGAGEVVGDTGKLFNTGDSQKLAGLLEETFALDNDEKERVQGLMEQRVKLNFEDKVAVERFFKLDVMN